MSDGIVIAGGGLAAQRCTETLRGQGYDGPIRIVCAERHPPYDRPPLSKELLAGDMPDEAVALRPRAWYEDRKVDLLLGTRAEELDLARRELRVAGHRRGLRFDSLLIATGSRPRTLPLLEGFRNVGVLRTLDDAVELRAGVSTGARLAVVGGGFIGLEAAATARKLGAHVTLVEALDTPLAAILGSRIGGWFADLHTDEGVEVLTNARVVSTLGSPRVHMLELADGRWIECDHVLVGVGVEPDTRWLAGTGLDAAGVRVDQHGRTPAPGVYAAGDCALTYDPALARHVRSDHWEAAARQGAAAARAMLALEPARTPLPSFWSDQYGVRVQFVGRADEADRIAVEGDPRGRDFQALFTKGELPVAALLVGRPRALAQVRKQVQAGLEALNCQTQEG